MKKAKRVLLGYLAQASGCRAAKTAKIFVPLPGRLGPAFP